MKVKELKRIIENLPDNMPITSFDKQGVIRNAVAFVDGEINVGEFPMEWLVIGVVEEELE